MQTKPSVASALATIALLARRLRWHDVDGNGEPIAKPCCNAFGGLWWVLSPAGAAITVK